jgi:hypothetical protein
VNLAVLIDVVAFQNLVLKNNTKTMEWWENSPIQPLLKVYIFNYTNIDDYLNNPKGKKIKVQEVGPYVYKEYGSRVNLNFEDQKITFNVSQADSEFSPQILIHFLSFRITKLLYLCRSCLTEL